ncbi:MAG: sigma-E factor negative regulatory protein RseC [Gammaproteobacteria bacterium]|jgi:sigma-E factor negative regulatory protein RseC
MIIEQAKVTRIVTSGVEVELLNQSGCEQCELQSGCGTGAIGKLLGNRQKPLFVSARPGMRVGDKLKIGVTEHSLYLVCLLMYGMPLVSMIISAIILTLLGIPEFLIILISVSILLATFSLISRLSNTIFVDAFKAKILSTDVGIDTNLNAISVKQ